MTRKIGRPAACKYKKVQVPGLRPGEIDVDALIRSLETRHASNHARQAESSGQEAAATPAPPVEGTSGARMSDEEFDEIARVMRKSRSIASARQWGLRLLAETRRARDAERRLAGNA